jgi:hypothetical protein
MMAPEKGPNRLNMKFTNAGTKLVIHLVRGLPKLSRDKKTITILFEEPPRNSRKSMRIYGIGAKDETRRQRISKAVEQRRSASAWRTARISNPYSLLRRRGTHAPISRTVRSLSTQSSCRLQSALFILTFIAISLL